MKLRLASLGLTLLLSLPAFGGEIDDLAGSLRAVLPKQGWTIEAGDASISIVGPKVKMIWPVSLPAEPEEKLWREYARSERIEVVIKFQRRISDDALIELRRLRARFYELTERGVDQTKKEWGEEIEEFGSVRIPDYRSASASIFVRKNTDGNWVRPVEALEVIARIEKLLATTFEKVQDEKDSANKVPEPMPGSVTPTVDAAVAPPEFAITKVEKNNDQVTVDVQAQRVVFTVTSSNGIGGFTAVLKSGHWPREVSVVLNRKSLEAFGFETDRLRAHGAVKPVTNCWAFFKFRDQKREADRDLPEADHPSAGSLNLQANATDGGIELIFPSNLFLDTRQFSFSWIDAYRR